MDDIDRQLIALLRNNARSSVTILARSLRVARGTVLNRIARLEASGTIMGYTVKLKSGTETSRVRAFMAVAVEGNKVDNVIRALRGEPAVAAVHSTNGRWDLVVELQEHTLEGFDRLLGRIRLIPGVSNTETHLLLSTLKL